MMDEQKEREDAEKFAREYCGSGLVDWSLHENMGATAPQRAYFRAGWLARAEIAERDMLDAERYRWLRNGNRRFDGARSNDGYLYGDELDAMIDTAMKEGGK